MNKIINHFKKNRGKLKDFGINSIAGIFSGISIGIFFSLTTDITFHRWIDPTTLELFPAIIYVIFVLFILTIFYGIGVLITWWLDKKKIMDFHISFIAGTYCSIMSFLFVLYYNVVLIRNVLAVAFIVIFLIVAYFTIKKKR